MRRRFFFILLIVLVGIGLAAPRALAAAEKAVWITPAGAKEGDAVELHAFVYNNAKETVTATVIFRWGDAQLGTVDVSVEKETGKIATIKTKLPKNGSIITAEVKRAVTATKIEVPQMVGVIDAITVGSSEPVVAQGSLKGFLGSVFAAIEPFRLKYADYFEQLRERKREAIGLEPGEWLKKALRETAPETPAAPSDDIPKNSFDYYTRGGINFADYGVLIYASIMSSLFSNMIVFYITGVLLVLVLLRLLFRIFF